MSGVFKLLSILLLGIFISGCGHSLKVYKKDQERVDQELPPGSDVEGRKKTRKVLFWEINRKKIDDEVSSTNTMDETTDSDVEDVGEDKSVEVSGGHDEAMDFSANDSTLSTSDESTKSWSRSRDVREERLNVESASSVSSSATGSTVSAADLPTDYTVQKDDTLQTISKKFYNSYSKWPKIYDANKEIIKDPNRIKPGITITIPAL